VIVYEAVLWSQVARPTDRRYLVERKAEGFLAALLRQLPCAWKNEHGEVVGMAIGARQAMLSGGTVAVLVQLRDGRT